MSLTSGSDTWYSFPWDDANLSPLVFGDGVRLGLRVVHLGSADQALDHYHAVAVLDRVADELEEQRSLAYVDDHRSL